MSRAGADAWATDSAIVAPVYHASSRDAAATIRREGFNPLLRRFGRVWGNSIYATPESIIASAYADLFGTEGVTLELRVNLSRVLSVKLVQPSSMDALRQILTSFPNGYSRFVELSIELGQTRPNAYVRPEALTRTLVEAGYDALEITEVGFHPSSRRVPTRRLRSAKGGGR